MNNTVTCQSQTAIDALDDRVVLRPLDDLVQTELVDAEYCVLLKDEIAKSGCWTHPIPIARETGQRPVLNPHAIPVEAGVVQLMTLAEAGYILVPLAAHDQGSYTKHINASIAYIIMYAAMNLGAFAVVQ